MKKFSAVLIILAITISMAACAKAGTPGTSMPSTLSPSTTSPSTISPSTTSPSVSTVTPSSSSTLPSTSTSTTSVAAGKYKDGTYAAKGDPWDKGQEEAMVVVKNGKITDITLKRLNTDGKTEVDYSLFDGKVHNGKQYPNLKEFKVDMAKRMIEKQSAQVDTIAGATTTTKNWTVAVQRALDKAK